jgi:hypothetical protein
VFLYFVCVMSINVISSGLYSVPHLLYFYHKHTAFTRMQDNIAPDYLSHSLVVRNMAVQNMCNILCGYKATPNFSDKYFVYIQVNVVGITTH